MTTDERRGSAAVGETVTVAMPSAGRHLGRTVPQRVREADDVDERAGDRAARLVGDPHLRRTARASEDARGELHVRDHELVRQRDGRDRDGGTARGRRWRRRATAVGPEVAVSGRGCYGR